MLKKNKTVHLRVETTLRIPVTLVLGLIQVWACSLPPSVASLEINQPSKWGSRLHLQLNYSFSRKDAGKGSPWTWRNACIQTFYYLRLQTEIETITSRQSLLLALHPFCIKRIKEKVWQKKKNLQTNLPTLCICMNLVYSHTRLAVYYAPKSGNYESNLQPLFS